MIAALGFVARDPMDDYVASRRNGIYHPRIPSTSKLRAIPRRCDPDVTT